MTYEQALAYWYGRVNFEQVSPEPNDLKLDRMRALLRLLGEPQRRFRIVHVAGSKGKGSTSAMLESIFRRAGYRTGLFTSPHLHRVEERIQVDGQEISASELTVLMAAVRDCQLGRLTFFEVATALGFLHFARRRVDVAVVEVGLGGRFDSTNVCRPIVSIITSISFDHTQQLGNRLASIAMEKAGIIKPYRPAVSGATGAEARRVIEEICRSRHSSLRRLGVDFHYRYEPGQVTKESRGQPGLEDTASFFNLTPEERPRVQIVTANQSWPAMELGLLGEHQAANAAVAVECVEQLRIEGLHIGDESVRAGLAGVRWPARMELLGRSPFVVLDCAHNVASAHALVDTVRASFPAMEPSRTPGAAGRRLLVFAGSSDKDLPGMLRLLGPHFAHAYLTRYDSPRSVPPERLAEIVTSNTGLPSTIFPTSAEAWLAARAAARPEDLICITGSVFLAGELRPMLIRGASG